MSHPCPLSSPQSANPSSALSRQVPAPSPASGSSQQAINMLKEQNRLLTKVSGVWGQEIPAGRGGGRNSRQRKVFLEAWPASVIPEKVVWAAPGDLASCSCVHPAGLRVHGPGMGIPARGGGDRS